MRPLKLSVSGFTCFKEPLEVDFRDLELFAIIGQTGAGKSSLLDAMTYALFGETPRLGSKGLEALVSLGGASMYACLEFEASDGRMYRVTRTWSKRAAEKQLRFDRVEGSRTVTVAESVKVKDVESAIERVVGLDFASFTRAILLPQGEFDRFLRGDAKERRDLLKGLLGLERIEAMMRRAGEIAREARTRLDTLQALVARDAGEVTPEALEGQHRALEETRTALQGVQVQLQAHGAQVEALRALARIGAELREASREYLAWQERAPEGRQARDRASAARRAAGVTPLIAGVERAAKLEDAARADVDLKRAKQRTLQAQHERALEMQQRTAQDALEVVDLDVRIAELNTARPIAERLRAIGGSLSDADPRYAWDETRYTRLEALKNSVALLKRLYKDLRELDSEARRSESEETRLTAALSSATSELDGLKTDGTTKGDAEKRLEASLREARRGDLVAQVVDGLQIGDPCPVCGEPLQELPAIAPSPVAALESELKTVRAALLELRAQYRAAQERLKHLREQLETLRASRAQTAERRSALEAELDALRAEFRAAVGDTDDPVSAVQEARAMLVAGLAAQVSALTGGADIEAQLVALGRKKRQLEDAGRAAEKALADAQAAILAGQAALDAAQAQWEERAAAATDLRAELSAALETAGFDTPEAARAAHLPEAEITALERFERDYDARLHALKERGLELRAQLNGQTPPSSQDLESAESHWRDLERQRAALIAAEARGVQVIADLQTRLRDKNRMTAEIAALETRFDVYAALNNDLKGNQFQDYLLAQVQRDLLERASSVIREVTHDRYTLALRDNEFCVLDAWNAMEPRSVKTLSGGESFIASLSLALALSDYLAGSKALGALFLDEGFGTLDSEALDAVTGVLETLNTRGRTVGVITHVSSLAERLPNRLMVEKAQGSSRAYWTD
jgi:exonuclease SbcC